MAVLMQRLAVGKVAQAVILEQCRPVMCCGVYKLGMEQEILALGVMNGISRRNSRVMTAATPPNKRLQPTRVPLRSTRAAERDRYDGRFARCASLAFVIVEL